MSKNNKNPKKNRGFVGPPSPPPQALSRSGLAPGAAVATVVGNSGVAATPASRAITPLSRPAQIPAPLASDSDLPSESARPDSLASLKDALSVTWSAFVGLFRERWLAWVCWLCAAVIVPVLGLMANHIRQLHSTIEDIRTEQRLTRSETEKAAQAEFAKNDKALASEIAKVRSAQESFRTQTEKDLQGRFAQLRESFYLDQKQRIDRLQVFVDSYDCLGKLCDTNTAKQYPESIRIFQEFCRKIPVNEIPFALKKPIYAEAARAYSIHGAYASVSDNELREMEAVLCDDLARKMTHFYLATLLLGKGHYDKARTRCKAGIDAWVECILGGSKYFCSADAFAEELSDYYGLLILTELVSSKRQTEPARINDCWAVLDECEQQVIVEPGLICERLGRSSFLAMTKHLKLAHPTDFASALKTMHDQLLHHHYVRVLEERGGEGGHLKETSLGRVKRRVFTRIRG